MGHAASLDGMGATGDSHGLCPGFEDNSRNDALITHRPVLDRMAEKKESKPELASAVARAVGPETRDDGQTRAVALDRIVGAIRWEAFWSNKSEAEMLRDIQKGLGIRPPGRPPNDRGH